jgi:hypothetical protein
MRKKKVGVERKEEKEEKEGKIIIIKKYQCMNLKDFLRCDNIHLYIAHTDFQQCYLSNQDSFQNHHKQRRVHCKCNLRKLKIKLKIKLKLMDQKKIKNKWD